MWLPWIRHEYKSRYRGRLEWVHRQDQCRGPDCRQQLLQVLGDLGVAEARHTPVDTAHLHRMRSDGGFCLAALDQVVVTVTASLARCGKLRQAILKRAFEGRLLPAA